MLVRLPALLWALVASSALGCATVTRQGLVEVEALERARFAAMTRQDIEALRPMLADDLRYCHSNGRCETKAQFLETLRTGDIRYLAIDVLDLHVRAANGAAIVHGTIDVAGEIGGQQIPLRLIFTDVYVRRDGRWQLAAWQSTRVPEAAQPSAR